MSFLLEGLDLIRRFRTRRRQVTAVDRVTVRLKAGASLGLVGESGSGKTTLGRMLCALECPDAGSVHFDGKAIDRRDRAHWTRFRSAVQYIFQDPGSALNPQRSIRVTIASGLTRHSRAERGRCCEQLAERVGISSELLERYPHELSGGQLQRVVIARALALEPRLLILDEPVSALDVSVQAQILALLGELRRDSGMGYLFISHDLAVVERICDEVVVMRDGRVVESGATDSVLSVPRDAYTRKLIAAVPSIESSRSPKGSPSLRSLFSDRLLGSTPSVTAIEPGTPVGWSHD